MLFTFDRGFNPISTVHCYLYTPISNTVHTLIKVMILILIVYH